MIRVTGSGLSTANVSRETLDRLHIFSDLLRKWNPAINLVSKSTLSTLWERHIADSLQVFDCCQHGPAWVDLGSGGGFPGVIVAILAQEQAPEMTVTLIESDHRKAAFLRTALRETGVTGRVLAQRIEAAPPQGADTVSARALANLESLLTHAARHLSDDGTALFQKGANWKKEVAGARLNWQFDLETITSVTAAEAVILKIRNIERA